VGVMITDNSLSLHIVYVLNGDTTEIHLLVE